MNQKQVNSKLNEIAMQLKSIDTIGLNYMEYLAALIYAIYGIEQEPNNFLIVKELVYTVQILDEQLYKIRKNERSEKLFINIRFREVIKNEKALRKEGRIRKKTCTMPHVRIILYCGGKEL